MRKGRPELLAPAGSYEGILAAAAAGADAVYVGGAQFGARAYAKNLSQEELLDAIDYLHIRGKKLFLTVNTLLKNKEMDSLFDYIAPLYAHGLDAVIVQDMGVLSYLSEQFPDLPLHASTQMTITGLSGIRYLEQYHVKRAVLARELSLDEITHICSNTDMEIECFIHGALCYCYSGQCLMSSILGGRSGNRGRCAQPCRLTYDAYRDGGKVNGKKDNYLLSPRDICTIDLLPQLLEAGVTSLKIEGRMKRAEYTAGVVSIYRKYLDLLEKKGAKGYKVAPEDRKILETLYTRSGFSEGYLQQHNGPGMMTLRKPDYITAEEEFYDSFRKKYIETKIQENVKGNLKLLKGMPVTIELEYSGNEGNIYVQVTGNPVQEALKQPMTWEKVETQIRKTGNTPFVFQKLSIEMDDDIFVPLQELNAVRRNALEELEKKLLQPARRDMPERKHWSSEGTSEYAERKVSPSVTVSVEHMGQLRAAIAFSQIRDIYVSEYALDGLFSKGHKEGEDLQALKMTSDLCHEHQKQCYFLMPYIFRKEVQERYEQLPRLLDEAGFDGAVVRSADELGFLKEAGYTGEIRSDYTFYTMNDKAYQVLHDQVTRDTIPMELNAKEMMRRTCGGSELVVYGYIPLMLSAQCVMKNLGQCRKKQGFFVLKDRYQKEFTVRMDCNSCMNIIYNSTPLVLMDCQEKIRKIGPRSLRLSFTMENEKETSMIIERFLKSFVERAESAPNTRMEDFTRGHFNRGVE